MEAIGNWHSTPPYRVHCLAAACTVLCCGGKIRSRFSRVGGELGELGKRFLVAHLIVATTAGAIVWALLRFSETADDFYSMLLSLILSALIAAAVFVAGLLLTKAGEKRIIGRLEKLDVLDEKMDLVVRKLERLDTMEVILVRILNMMEEDRGRPKSTLEDIRKEGGGGD